MSCRVLGDPDNWGAVIWSSLLLCPSPLSTAARAGGVWGTFRAGPGEAPAPFPQPMFGLWLQQGHKRQRGEGAGAGPAASPCAGASRGADTGNRGRGDPLESSGCPPSPLVPSPCPTGPVSSPSTRGLVLPSPRCPLSPGRALPHPRGSPGGWGSRAGFVRCHPRWSGSGRAREVLRMPEPGILGPGETGVG